MNARTYVTHHCGRSDARVWTTLRGNETYEGLYIFQNYITYLYGKGSLLHIWTYEVDQSFAIPFPMDGTECIFIYTGWYDG